MRTTNVLLLGLHIRLLSGDKDTKNYLKTKTQEGTESSNAPAESNPLTVTAQVHNTEGDGQIRYFNNLELKCFDLLPSTKTYLCIDNEKI